MVRSPHGGGVKGDLQSPPLRRHPSIAVLLTRMPLTLLTPEELAPTLPRHARLMGIDLGAATVGLALSDVERRIASPLETIVRTKFSSDAASLHALARKYEVGALVIGMPLNMDGSSGPRVQATRAFMRNYAALHACIFVAWDERLSTAAVTRSLIEQDVSRAKRALVVDKMAAAYILQGVLDRLNYLSRPSR